MTNLMDGNSCERYTFLYQYTIQPPMPVTACIPLGTESCMFWTVSRGLLYHSSWRTSTCLRDDGGGNLLLTLLSKTDNSDSMIFVWRLCWPGRMFKCSSDQDLTLLAVCISKLSSWKPALLGNTWAVGCTRLPKCPHSHWHDSTIQGNYRTRRMPIYWCPNHHRSVSMFHSWNQAFRTTGFLGLSPNIHKARCWKQREGQFIWPYCMLALIRHSGFMIITPPFFPF